MRGSQGAGQVTMQVTTLSGTGRGYRDGQLEQAMFAVPTGCACDAEGNVYIADQMNHRIRKVGPGTCCSPCHRVPFNSINEGPECIG